MERDWDAKALEVLRAMTYSRIPALMGIVLTDALRAAYDAGRADERAERGKSLTVGKVNVDRLYDASANPNKLTP